MNPAPTLIAGRYRIIRELGRGRMVVKIVDADGLDLPLLLPW